MEGKRLWFGREGMRERVEQGGGRGEEQWIGGGGRDGSGGGRGEGVERGGGREGEGEEQGEEERVG